MKSVLFSVSAAVLALDFVDAVCRSRTQDFFDRPYLGRQHYSFGTKVNYGIIVVNSFINEATSNSASCDDRTYQGIA